MKTRKPAPHSPLCSAPGPFAYLLVSKNSAPKKLAKALRAAPAPPPRAPVAAASPAARAPSFTHLRPAPGAHAYLAPTRPTPTLGQLRADAEAAEEAQARATGDFILNAAAMSTGEKLAPREKPANMAESQRAAVDGAFILAAARKARGEAS